MGCDKLIQLWSAAKAEVICMDVAKHDEVLAHTSHLPHLMAFNLVEQLANREDNLDIFRYAAGGFRDFSRIAASDPQCGMTFSLPIKQPYKCCRWLRKATYRT